jgi:hypothetical protein
MMQPPHNNGMHPTADTRDVINSNRLGRRVMPALDCFLLIERPGT